MKTIIRSDLSILAERIASEGEFEKSIARWSHQGQEAHDLGDEELAQAYASDVRDLKRFLQMYKEGKLDEAWAMARNLDTIVRELIPDPIYNFLRDREG